LARFNVPPSVADHEAGSQVDSPVTRCCEQEARLRLPAVTAISVIVVADPNIVKVDRFSQMPMDRLYDLAPLCAACDIGLVRCHDQEKAERAELPAGIVSAGHEDKLVKS